MIWKKKGLIYSPRLKYSWNMKYGILPVPYYISQKNIIRIFYGTTDIDTYGRVSYVDVSAENPSEIVYEHSEVILDLGSEGTFDDCGVVPSSIIKVDGKYLLFTVGFQRTVKTPYLLFPGLAISDDLSNFKRYSKAPILNRNQHRYLCHGAPSVIFDKNIYKMWHWYATQWITVGDKKYMDYRIGYAESVDCYRWEIKDICCIDINSEKGEFAVARPWVYYENGLYMMYYSTRYNDKLYRITHATSKDGINWDKKGSPFDVSDSGWDSEMICYPSTIKINDTLYLFYNGNNNGETGFGYAELSQ